MKSRRVHVFVAIIVAIFISLLISQIPSFARGAAGEREGRNKGKAPILEREDETPSATPSQKTTPISEKVKHTETPDEKELPSPAETGTSRTNEEKEVETPATPERILITPKPIYTDTKISPTATPDKVTPIITPTITPTKVKTSPKPVSPDEPKSYKGGGWDHFARQVRFTVQQEDQLKILLTKERDDILKARADAIEKIKKVLNDKQRQKWEQLYASAKKISGPESGIKKSMLINPDYLRSVLGLNDAQRKQIYNIAWEYARKVDKVRKQTTKKVEKILTTEQMVKWNETTRYRISK